MDNNVLIPRQISQNQNTSLLIENANYRPVWFWVDIEATSLNIHSPNFHILEIAVIVTNADFSVKDSFHVVINQPEYVIEHSSKWCKKTFSSRQYGGNALFSFVRDSRIPESHAGRLLEGFIVKNMKENIAINNNVALGDINERDLTGRNKAVLAGCSVNYDYSAIIKTYPYLSKYLSHQIVDATSFLHTVKRFAPTKLSQLPVLLNHENHRAQVDILASIRLFKWFKSTFIDNASP